ncbi:MAG: M14 family metallopeptidase [Clostridium sp.]|uniref:M14 family metallopeptidase n=1 Tax=Clostridium sp. TaxID=1506 RepID=UPI002A8841FE|nr:M14 family metallopeptidase [Clostridium sp.]MDY5097524.1 M14 family metallopeptidase [Clostridium sp.]
MESLEKLFTSYGILNMTNDSNEADGIKGKIIIASNSSKGEKLLAVNLSGRIGYQCTAIDLPLLEISESSKIDGNDNIEIKQAEFIEAGHGIIELRHGNVVLSARDEEGFAGISEYICGRFPYIWSVEKDSATLHDIKELFGDCEISLERIILNHKKQGLEKITIRVSEDDLHKVKEALKEKNIQAIKGLEVIEVVSASNSFQVPVGVVLEKLDMKMQCNSSKEEESVDLCHLTSLETGLLRDTDNDFLPDELNFCVTIKENGLDEEIIAASNIAAALSINSLGYSYPLAYVENTFEKPNDTIEIAVGNHKLGCSTIQYKGNEKKLLVSGEAHDIEALSQYFARNYEYLIKEDEITLKDFKDDLYKTLFGKNLLGQIGRLEYISSKEKSIDTMNSYLDIKNQEENISVSRYMKKKSNIKDFEINNYREKINVFEKEYNFKWEVDEAKEILESSLYKELKPEDKVEIKILVSEEPEVRDALKKDIEEKIAKTGAIIEKCSVLSSYKQGLSWIMEEVIPSLKDRRCLDNIEAIDIKFKPFLPEGQDTWSDEDGAIPNINASREDNPDKWFDLPIRRVQELFPVDDLISQEINLERDKINFSILEGGDNDYEIIVWDKDGKNIYNDGFNGIYSERPYLDEYKGIGKVHPNAALVEAKINGKVIVSEVIKTDVEKVWDVYQSEILSACKDYILEKTDNNPTADKQPFFDQLRIDVLTSEPDYKLDVRKDIISVLSALHEDIYFAGLDFFKTLGLKTVNQGLDEPGLILPVLNKRNGKGTYMKATLKVEQYKKPFVIIDGKEQDLLGDYEFDININKFTVKNGHMDKLYVNIKSEDKEVYEVLKSIKAVAEDIGLPEEYSFNTLVFIYSVDGVEKNIEISNINQYKKSNEILSIKDIEMPQTEVIGYDDYIGIIEKLKKVPEIKVWKASKSYQGRDIYAIEIIKQYKSSLVSRTKVINNRPVFQLNNRHHANEVSSTNSSFLLLQKMLLEEDYKKYRDKLNVVMIPFENVDGGYIHYELQKDNPEWQFHIARFNSVGKEFAREYFKEDTRYTESLAFTKLWRKWLPDIVVDNHGVPKHEWDQQFSGYVAPWFKGFWLPRALFYGYFWYLDTPEYPANKILSEALQDVVSDYINADSEIVRWNRDWQNRFEKYAHQWMPKLFPANYYKELIYYWLPYQPNKDSWQVSHRYPWITALNWTTEVSDETAQGEYLDLCSRTHHISDVANMDMMVNASFKVKKEAKELEGKISLKNIRIRPIEV